MMTGAEEEEEERSQRETENGCDSEIQDICQDNVITTPLTRSVLNLLFAVSFVDYNIFPDFCVVSLCCRWERLISMSLTLTPGSR